MIYSWETSTTEIKDYVYKVLEQIKESLQDNFKGFYVHGSLAMDGFNPQSSEIDLIVVTENPLTFEAKKELVNYFLSNSGKPFPIEVSFLNTDQLRNWQHPCPYDFHYSEYWREKYEEKADYYLNKADLKDSDLAAHITILHRRGICLEGPPIEEVFPLVPQSDYLSSVMEDYRECLANLEKDPKYCVLNMVRVYWYVKAGIITSKQEAGQWAINTLPKMVAETVQKVMDGNRPEEKELQEFKEYIDTKLTQ
ncbi:aminoglycoside adenylyltransferase domain-containing protein [Bacillus sp. D386]|uniref:aminoglycoside adenylyltransferase domain-containing protein n=1 Tax=Bacillus sp. D386 TaxID=2587155 RepID=UPI00111F5633|nr:aminoglycoside adenylyltransferase domain-containing protein [Bacillus sp. D386]